MTADSSARRTPALLTPALAVLVPLLVLLAGFLAWRYVHFEDGPSKVGGDRSTFVPDAERSDVLRVAEQYALRVDAYDGAQPQAYADKVDELLTTKGRTKFDKDWAAIVKLGVDKKLKGKGDILASGVVDIDPDSATVLVAHDAVVTSSQGNVGRHHRWLVQLEKVKGKWLVDNFTPE